MQKRDQKISLIKNALGELANNSSDCYLCPRMCHVNRDKGEIGFCGVGNHPFVSNYCVHFGEKPCLSGYYDYKKDLKTVSSLSGSGAVFFAGCNLRCIFCQNYQKTIYFLILTKTIHFLGMRSEVSQQFY